jgi:hypothetical protein
MLERHSAAVVMACVRRGCRFLFEYAAGRIVFAEKLWSSAGTSYVVAAYVVVDARRDGIVGC